MTKTSACDLVRISVRGVVQGVGFRPFVYQLANRHDLKGWVCNTSEDVKIEVEGDTESIRQFLQDLTTKAPPRASIDGITTQHLHGRPKQYDNFEIRHSVAEEGKYQLLSPDIATCQDCLSEILSPDDRRYRYPFTNCTNCGPRFTIIEDIPYDRPKTTMRQFRMCPECQSEYDDPLNRRFHAQPNSCPVCGPVLQLLDAESSPVDGDAITVTSQLLREGKIVAIKGLGGFLLACDATSENVVKLLRQRKARPSKPFAIMVSSIDEAREHCDINTEEERLLESPNSPIVLIRWKDASSVARAVAPGLKYLGVMLPYTPLHHLLLRETGIPLVMTSGNLSEEPIAKDNDEALRRLSGIADYFLVHNRDIYARYDDSVTLVEKGIPRIVRRARGYAPYPIHLGFNSRQILACGAEEKNTFCLTRDNYAFISQHIGDMENLDTMESFEDTIDLYKKLFRIEPEIIAYDMHPEYLSTKYARQTATNSGITLIPVQHHHAHIASCMADNDVDSQVIGVALDGTGYGTDGNIWGGEFMIADYGGFTRVGQFEYLPLPGGALAIRKPFRTAIGYLLSLLGNTALDFDLPLWKYVDRVETDIIKKQLERRVNSPLTSSCGRLFDAVSALIGVRGEIEYEAQAAIELEMLACEAPDEPGSYPIVIIEQSGMHIIKLKELLSAVITDLQHGVDKSKIAARFHNSIALMIAELCREISHKTGINQVALSGGVFQNRLLFRKTVDLLEKEKYKVLAHRNVPTNDGGISLGQAVIANFAVNKE
jgi:hydrogenase maturation protein HypF